MPVRCPECQTEQPAGGADRDGRMMQCVACGMRWLARPYEGILPVRSPVPMVVDAVVIEETVADELSAGPLPRRGRRARAATGSAWAPRVPWPMERRLKALGIAAGVVAALIVLRAPLVSALPETGALPAGADRLEFRKISSETVRLRSVDTLIIQGEVVNPSRDAVALPAVEITLRSEGGETLSTWQVELGKDVLSPGGHIGFRSALDTPPDGATQISLNLVERDSDLR